MKKKEELQTSMEILVNGREYLVRLLEEDNPIVEDTWGDDTVSGWCDRFNNIINIVISNKSLMIDTVYHELCHAYIMVYGLVQLDSYSEENVCDMFGAFGRDLGLNATNIINTLILPYWKKQLKED